MTVYKAPGVFRPKFSRKKIHEQVAFGFRSPEAYGHWLEKGVSLDARSRLKGIETNIDLHHQDTQADFGCPFPLEGN